MCLLLSSDAALLAYAELGPASDRLVVSACDALAVFISALLMLPALSMGASDQFTKEESKLLVKLSEFTLKSQSCV